MKSQECFHEIRLPEDATHVTVGMLVSIAVSVISLLLNWQLMRRGLLVTGAGSARLLDDLRRLPAALLDWCGGERA